MRAEDHPFLAPLYIAWTAELKEFDSTIQNYQWADQISVATKVLILPPKHPIA